MNNPEATAQALELLRNGDAFQWYIIPMLALVMYIYGNEYANRNWKGIAAGLALYSVHWFFEILNALIQHITKHDVIPSDAQLAALVTACAQQLAERAQVRERRAVAASAAAKAAPGKPDTWQMTFVN